MSNSTVIRTSDRVKYRKCRQLWDFSSDIRMGYKPVKEIEALEFGTAIHAGLEAWYNSFSFPYEVKYAVMLKAFIETVNSQLRELEDNPHFTVDSETEQEFEERRVLGTGMLNYYADYSMKNDSFEVVDVEYEFQIPLFDSVVYEGKIDLIVRDSHGEIYLIDHKTAGRLGGTGWLDVDTQISSYCWALWEEGYNVAGFTYNQLFKGYPKRPNVNKNGSLSKDKNQHTTYDMYCEALEEEGLDSKDYTDMLDHLKNNPKEYVRRRTVTRSESELEQQRSIIMSEAREMVNDPVIYPNPNEFNCNSCKFFEPCLARLEQSDPYDFLDNPELYIQGQ